MADLKTLPQIILTSKGPYDPKDPSTKAKIRTVVTHRNRDFAYSVPGGAKFKWTPKAYERCV